MVSGTSTREISHIDVALTQCFKQFLCRTGLMCCKNKVRFGVLKRKSEFAEFLLCPLSCLYDLMTGLTEILLIFDCCHTCCQGSPVHSVRVKGIFGIIQIFYQLR